jgi:hypothetical protein
MGKSYAQNPCVSLLITALRSSQASDPYKKYRTAQKALLPVIHSFYGDPSTKNPLARLTAHPQGCSVAGLVSVPVHLTSVLYGGSYQRAQPHRQLIDNLFQGNSEVTHQVIPVVTALVSVVVTLEVTVWSALCADHPSNRGTLGEGYVQVGLP